MISHVVPLLCLLASADATPAKDVQRDGLVAIWVAPMVLRQTVVPVAAQIGVQLGPRAMINAFYGELPLPNIKATAWTVGARWYATEVALAPFLTAEAGKMSQEQDDTGGRRDTYAFGSIGVGLERVWAHHFSFSMDLQGGPGRRESGSYHEATWLFWLQYRLALGVRF
jgi:hypothetical protein